MSGNFSLTKIRPGSQWKMPTKFSSKNTALKWTKRQPPLQSMPSQRIKRQSPLSKKLLLSGNNRSNKHELLNKTLATMVIDPEDKALPDQILMGDRTIRPIKQAPTPQETVNFVFLANSLTTRNKNAANVSVITSHVLTTKDNYTGQKLTLQLKMPMPLKIMVNPMMEIVWFFCKEHHGTPHECSKCHSSIDFKFVHYFHHNMQ
jgi:hypothetical protein